MAERQAAAAGRVRVAGLVLAAGLPGARGALASSAAVAVALAEAASARRLAGGAVLLIEIGGRPHRGPTLLASGSAREAESRITAAGHDAAARGRLAWVCLGDGDDWQSELAEVLAVARPYRAAVAHLPPARWREAIGRPAVAPSAALLNAELPAQRRLAGLASRALRAEAISHRINGVTPGRVASRRALAGLSPGGEASRRAGRIAAALAGSVPGRHRPARALRESGQALPLVLGAAAVLVLASLVLAAFGGAVTGKSRAQRLADLAALSAARSLRDDLDRLLAPPELPGGAPNPRHLDKAEYLTRAEAAGLEAGRRNGADPGRLELSFPDQASFAPLRTRVELRAELRLPGAVPDLPVSVAAEAEAAAPASAAEAQLGAASTADGGGYSGPLAHRQGEPMRPDVAVAFDRLAAAARAAGFALVVSSAFRSDAEQAALWAQNPDPRWVAPPGTSLHRCATELDLGPPAAYGWLAANARRFGFLRRYAWEPWHFGYVAGPAPCSSAGARAQTPSGDGARGEDALPAFVPARFRNAIALAAGRWNVSPSLLAAQLMAESNFNPYAVSPAGARGIAQFMPGTAAAYGLRDPFDPEAAIDAQAHLMSDLLRQFGGAVALALAAYNAGPGAVAACSCVPPYPETQGYVARILALMDGAGALAVPELEVRLVS